VADKVGEVAKAVPVKRSVKAIPNNSPWFLVILIEIFTLFLWGQNEVGFLGY
jgi:hypothetical protein